MGSLKEMGDAVTLRYASLLAEVSGSVGRALDWGLKGFWFKLHCQWSRYAVSLSKTLYRLLSTGSTQDNPSSHD